MGLRPSPFSAPHSMHILYLSRVRQNPYVNLLARGVHQADTTLRPMHTPTLSWPRLLDWRWRILHLHWVELQYAYGATSHQQAQKALNTLLRQLSFLQKTGRKLVYTVHNINQHEGQHPDLNQRANDWLFAHADAIHAHNRAAAQQVQQRYGREVMVFTIPHGNYVGVYPNDISRAQARDQLGIPQNHFVYLYLGQMRPYKGLDALIAAFRATAQADASLILAGRVATESCQEHLQAQIAQHPHIHLIPRFVPDAHIQRYCNAADICVLPYRDATTSGAALLAFSFARPIIAPALGPFPELVGNNARGILFDPQQQDLTQALVQAREADLPQLSRAAHNLAQSRNWLTIGQQHAQVYRQLLTGM